MPQNIDSVLESLKKEIAACDADLEILDVERRKLKAQGKKINEKKRGAALLFAAIVKSRANKPLKEEERNALSESGLTIVIEPGRVLLTASAR